MRIKIILSKSNSCIPFTYQGLMLGTIHKWFGANNKLHDKLSLYNYSWLKGFRINKYGLIADKQPYFYFSCFDDRLIDRLNAGICKDKSMFNGFEVIRIENIDCEIKECYEPLSPIFVKEKTENNSLEHLLFDNPKTETIMTNLMRNKMKFANVNFELESIKFEVSEHSKTKLVKIHGINSRANLCNVKIVGDENAHKFILDVGVGHSTGSGFGCIC